MRNTELKLPDLKLLCQNEAEAAWATSKLYALLPDARQTTACMKDVYWLYYNSSRNTFGYDTAEGYDITTGDVHANGCYPERTCYNVSELMSPLEDGAYQIEQIQEGKAWLEMLLLKFLLQGVMDLKEYDLAFRHKSQIRQSI